MAGLRSPPGSGVFAPLVGALLLAGCGDRIQTSPMLEGPGWTAGFEPRVVAAGDESVLNVEMRDRTRPTFDDEYGPIGFRAFLWLPEGLELRSSPEWNGTIESQGTRPHSWRVLANTAGEWEAKVNLTYFVGTRFESEQYGPVVPITVTAKMSQPFGDPAILHDLRTRMFRAAGPRGVAFLRLR